MIKPTHKLTIIENCGGWLTDKVQEEEKQYEVK